MIESLWRAAVLGSLFIAPVSHAQVLVDGVVDPRIDERAGEATFRRPDGSGVVWVSDSIERRGSLFLRLHFTDIQDDGEVPYIVEIVDGDKTLLALIPEQLTRRDDLWTPKLESSRAQVVVKVQGDDKPAGLSFNLSQLAYQRTEAQILSTSGRTPNYTHLYEHADDARLMAAARTVARLDFIAGGQTKTCTGFLIAGNRLLTNDHCISDQGVCETTWVTFDHRRSAADGPVVSGPRYPCKKLLASDGDELAKLDAAVIEVDGDPGADGRIPLAFSARAADSSHELLIIHHPGGEPMRISQERCRVRTREAPGRDDRLVDFGHLCDTNPGSSGAPVLDRSTLEVVGLHHWGFDIWGRFKRENRAVHIEHVRPAIP